MKRASLFAPVLLAASLPALAATAGQSAPDFTATDSHGKSIQQGLQSEWVAKNVVWLSIDSSSRSSYDFLPPEKLGAWMQAKGAAQSAVLVDPEGATAKLYQAKTTPHIFVIDPSAKIVCAGALDARPSTDPKIRRRRLTTCGPR
jgi:hypothetical protein